MRQPEPGGERQAICFSLVEAHEGSGKKNMRRHEGNWGGGRRGQSRDTGHRGCTNSSANFLLLVIEVEGRERLGKNWLAKKKSVKNAAISRGAQRQTGGKLVTKNKNHAWRKDEEFCSLLIGDGGDKKVWE